MYSLVMFLVVSLVALTLAIGTRHAKIWLVGSWSQASAAALLTHDFACFVWIACLSWLALSPRPIERTWLAGGVVMTALLVLPWYAYSARDARPMACNRVPGLRPGQPPSGALRPLLGHADLPLWSGVLGKLLTRSQWLAALAFGVVAVAFGLALRRRLFSGERGTHMALGRGRMRGAGSVRPHEGDDNRRDPALRSGRPSRRPRPCRGRPEPCSTVPHASRCFSSSCSRGALESVLFSVFHRVSTSRIGRLPRSLNQTVTTEDLVLADPHPVGGARGIARYVNGATMVASWSRTARPEAGAGGCGGTH